MEKKRFKIYTLGCKVNQCDSAALANRLAGAGLQSVRSKADYALVNTCAVTRIAVRKSRQMASRARRENPRAKLLIFGCWPRLEPKETADIYGPDAIRGSRVVDCLLNNRVKKENNCPAKNWPISGQNRFRYFLKVQDGCEQYCAYCAIPFIRGKLSYKSRREALAEARAALLSGHKEIVVCGIHLGLYGQGKSTSRERINLTGLLEKILELPGLGRMRLSSIEATEATRELIALAKRDRRVCPHFHLPLQSGSDKILALMNRPYRVKEFIAKVKEIRKQLPLAAITTDVIVGFPGESEADFKKTRYLTEKLKFSRLHIFPYSIRPKTAASALPGQVDKTVIADRIVKLRRLNKVLMENYRRRFKGKQVNVLIEKNQDGIYRGKSEFYFDVKINRAPGEKKLVLGKICPVKLKAA